MEITWLTESNPWWGKKEAIQQDEKVTDALKWKNQMPVIFEDKNTLLIGPRQVGKTTHLKLFIKHLIENGVNPKNIFFASCEPIKKTEDLIEVFRTSDSLAKGKKYILLDEVTYVEEWQRAIKYVLDGELKKDKTIIITGSSSIKLKKETFPGRDLVTKPFLPLSFKEFCKVFGSTELKNQLTRTKENNGGINDAAKQLIFYLKETNELFAKYIQCGGFARPMYELM
ncbi:MAG: AAA family ATPase, partial [Candidatus Micrarchaeota archaeon]